jgi:hypothetical protein
VNVFADSLCTLITGYRKSVSALTVVHATNEMSAFDIMTKTCELATIMESVAQLCQEIERVRMIHCDIVNLHCDIQL